MPASPARRAAFPAQVAAETLDGSLVRLFARINQRDGTGWIGIMALDMDAIRKAAERVATTLGLDVVDVAFSNHGRQRVLTVSLEKNAAGRAALFPSIPAESGAAALAALGIPESVANGTIHPDQLSWLTHEDCAAFSRDFGTLLDVENLGPDEEYTLEASSPGLDRSLSTLPEFVRFRGALVRIQTFEPVANNRHWQGRLTDADETRVALDLKATRQNSKSRKAGVDQVEITLRNIERAQLIPEF